jgi:hypothetical protein
VDEFVEYSLRGVEPPFDFGGRSAQGRGVLIARVRLSGDRIAQESLASDAVLGRAVRRHECLRLAGGEGVSACRGGQLHLGPGTEGAKL